MSLRKLCFVAGIAANGAVSVLYAGLDANEARAAFRAAPEDLLEVAAFKRPRHWKRRKGSVIEESAEEPNGELVPESGTQDVAEPVGAATEAPAAEESKKKNRKRK